MNDTWQSTAAAFEEAARPLLERGIRLTLMGPFDTKGQVWCASRPGSPDVFFWSSRIGPDIRAFAGTANRLMKDVEFLNPLSFEAGEWVARDWADRGEALARAVEAALSWADDHVPPHRRGG